MKLEDLDDDVLDELVLDLEDLRHDLGKYIRFEARFAGAEASDEALATALRRDLLATRRRGDAAETAWQVWARLRPSVLDGDQDVAEIDAAMVALGEIDLDGPREALDGACALTGAVSEATRRLLARARARQND